VNSVDPTGTVGVWKVVTCVASIAALVGTVGIAARAVRALGGIRETARLLVGAGDAGDFLRITGGVGASLLGFAGIRSNCF